MNCETESSWSQAKTTDLFGSGTKILQKQQIIQD